MNEYTDYDFMLASECREYLALSDEELAGYGLSRAALQHQLSLMEAK